MVLKGGFVTGTGQAPSGFQDASACAPSAADADHGDAGPAPHVNAEIKTGELDEYIVGQLFRRLETEPQFLARCVAVLDETELDEGLAEELEELESDPGILLSVLRAFPRGLAAAGPGRATANDRLRHRPGHDRTAVGLHR
jgi:hypothetical protein